MLASVSTSFPVDALGFQNYEVSMYFKIIPFKPDAGSL